MGAACSKPPAAVAPPKQSASPRKAVAPLPPSPITPAGSSPMSTTRRRSVVNFVQASDVVPERPKAISRASMDLDDVTESMTPRQPRGRRFSIQQSIQQQSMLGTNNPSVTAKVSTSSILEAIKDKDRESGADEDSERLSGTRTGRKSPHSKPLAEDLARRSHRFDFQKEEERMKARGRGHSIIIAETSEPIAEVRSKDQEGAAAVDDSSGDEQKSRGDSPMGALAADAPLAAPEAGAETSMRASRSHRLGSKAVSRSRLKSTEGLAISDELTEQLNRLSQGAAKITPTKEPSEYIGTYTCRGMESGKLKQNQDFACTAQPFADIPGAALMIVCDGHGRKGHDVSQEALNALLIELEEQTEQLVQEPGPTIASAFEAVNTHLADMASESEIEVNAMDSGACAVLAWAKGSSLWVGGLGDCRVVLGTRHADGMHAVALTTDHAVDVPLERERLEANGGQIRKAFVDEDGQTLAAKLYEDLEDQKRGPGLSVSRAFGDLSASHLGVISTPELTYHKVTKEDEFLVLATDGVWEFLESEDVVKMVDRSFSSGRPAEDACKYIIARSAKAWQHHEGDYRDDITVIVVYLQGLIASLRHEAGGNSSNTSPFPPRGDP
jgi:serine/threonine protein phosphatase PrpC